MPAWNNHPGPIEAATAESGPFTLAAYGEPGSICWEVTWTGPQDAALAEGLATTMHEARSAAEAAAQLMAACLGGDASQEPQPRGMHAHSETAAPAADRRPGRASPRRPRSAMRRRR